MPQALHWLTTSISDSLRSRSWEKKRTQGSKTHRRTFAAKHNSQVQGRISWKWRNIPLIEASVHDLIEWKQFVSHFWGVHPKQRWKIWSILCFGRGKGNSYNRRWMCLTEKAIGVVLHWLRVEISAHEIKRPVSHETFNFCWHKILWSWIIKIENLNKDLRHGLIG